MPNPPHSTADLAIRAVSRSDVGMRRPTNQDSVAVWPATSGSPIADEALLMVADGMGAHAAGELASQMAVESIPHEYLKSTDEAAPSALRNAIRLANEKINSKGASAPEFHGMGTTCSCLVVTQGAALVGHVGDSRVYRLRDGVLEQLTFDHSLVWEMAAASNVSEEKVPSCIPKNVITRSLGPHESVIVDLEGPHALEADDTFLLCSDGLTGVVDDTLTAGVLASLEPDAAAETLIDLANLRGGPDNISVIVARVERKNEGGEAPKVAEPPKERSGGRGFAIAAAIACLIACGGFLGAGHMTGSLLSAVGLGAAIAYIFAQGSAMAEGASTVPKLLGGPYGNGPYRRIDSGDGSAAAGDLRDLVRELASLKSEEDTVSTDGSNALPADVAGVSGGFTLDWAPFAANHQAGDAAFDSGDFSKAITIYSGVIRDVMLAAREDDSTHRYRASTQVLG